MAVLLKVFLAVGFIALHAKADYCPRSGEFSLDEGRRCRKQCLTNGDCKARNKECICDEECGLSCINKESECGEPVSIADGRVTWSDVRWASKAYYKCNESFALVGDRVRRCNADKKWGGTPPFCEKGCFRPDDASDSYTIKGENGFRVGHSYTFSCKTGYYMLGSSERTCISANSGWSNLNYTCKLKQCDVIGDVFNGELRVTKGNQFGSIATVRCYEGYKASSSGSMRCYSGTRNSFYGEWMGTLPSCDLITCKRPESLRHGFISNLEHVSFKYGTEISYHCVDGYKLQGPEIRRCNQNGEWGKETACVENFDCNFDDPNSCGYVPIKWERVKFADHNGWNGFVMKSTSDENCFLVSPEITIGWTTQYACVMFAYRIPQEGGILAIEEAYERRTLWQSLPNDSNDQWLEGVANLDASSGLTFHFYTTRRSVLVGNVTVLPEKCDFTCIPPVPRGNSRLVNDKSEWLTGDHASFECLDGLHSRHPETLKRMETKIICRDTGRWTSSPPICIKPVCAILDRQPGHARAVTPRPTYSVGETVQLKCGIGHELIGNTTLTCVSMASWDHSMPECRKKSCGHAPAIQLGAPLSDFELRYGDFVDYECTENGYYIEGSSTIKCRFDGSFSRLPSCRRRQSCSLPKLKNGWTENNGGITYYHCHAMYELVGPNGIQCNQDGTWSGSTPYCRELQPTKKLEYENMEYLIYMQPELKTNYINAQKLCNAIGSNLAIIYSDSLREAIETKLKTINHDRYHILFGMKMVRGYHRWDLKKLKSRLRSEQKNSRYRYWKVGSGNEDCVAIERIDMGGFIDVFVKDYPWTTVACNGRHGFMCQRDYPCNPESCLNGGTCFDLNGRAACSCAEGYTGKKCEQNMKCYIDDLDQLLTAHGQENMVPVGLQVVVSCPDEYKLVGSNKIDCLPNGKWNTYGSACQKISCDTTPSVLPENILISSSDLGSPQSYLVKSEITFECGGGAALFGNPTSVCGFDENWSEITAVCKDTTCDSPALPNFAFILGDVERSYSSGTSITLGCPEDRLIDGDPVWHCRNGQWLQTGVRCTVKFCTVDLILLSIGVEIRNYTLDRINNVNFEIGDDITLGCDDGSTPVHWERPNVDQTIVCQKGGKWSTPYGEFDCN